MANPEHLEILKQGVEVWNNWRKENPEIVPDLVSAGLSGIDLSGADLRWADLRSSNLSSSNLSNVDLRGAELRLANLSGSNLGGADLRGVHFGGTNLFTANLKKADMRYSTIIGVDFRGTVLSGCKVYGMSAWDLNMDDTTKQDSLIVSPYKEPEITVDNLEIAQFLYLVLNNDKLGNIITTMRTKAVLVLGSFGSDESKSRLDEIRIELSNRGYMPLTFTFDTSVTNFPMETVKTLALLSNFVVIDLSEPAGQLAEMAALVPETYIPFIQIAREGSHVTWMLKGPQHWVSDLIRYSDDEMADLPAFMENRVLPYAKDINEQLREKRREMWD